MATLGPLHHPKAQMATIVLGVTWLCQAQMDKNMMEEDSFLSGWGIDSKGTVLSDGQCSKLGAKCPASTSPPCAMLYQHS